MSITMKVLENGWKDLDQKIVKLICTEENSADGQHIYLLGQCLDTDKIYFIARKELEDGE